MALRDVWTTMEDAISDGKIRVKTGKLSDLSKGPLFTDNSNIVAIDKESFLSWYRRDKEKIVQYLSCVDLKIYQEEFLNRLAKANQSNRPILRSSPPTVSDVAHCSIRISVRCFRIRRSPSAAPTKKNHLRRAPWTMPDTQVHPVWPVHSMNSPLHFANIHRHGPSSNCSASTRASPQ